MDEASMILLTAGDISRPAPVMSVNSPGISEVDTISVRARFCLWPPLSLTMPSVTRKSVAMKASGLMPMSWTTRS